MTKTLLGANIILLVVSFLYFRLIYRTIKLNQWLEFTQKGGTLGELNRRLKKEGKL